MTKIDIKVIKKLREATGAPVIRVKKVLEEVKGDEKKAKEKLMKEGFEKMSKRADRETNQGIVAAYTHHNKKVVGVVQLFCETDFVARNKLFVDLGHNLAMQAASMGVPSQKEFAKQEFIKDPSKTISDLVKEVAVKTGENIRLGDAVRIELGK